MRPKEVNLKDLKVGDLIRVHWLDASEDTRPLHKNPKAFDVPIRSYGIFLGVKGYRTKHVIIAKEVIEYDKTFHYNCIPVGMIEQIVLINKGELPKNLLTHLTRKVTRTSIKRFRKWKYGGWMKYV